MRELTSKDSVLKRIACVGGRHALRWAHLCAFAFALLLCPPAFAAKAPTGTLLVLGDSLSAGYGIARESGWVDLMRTRMSQSYPDYRVVNASISGDTSSGGRARLPALLAREKPTLVLLELGANDALRGTPIESTRANLAAIIEASQRAGAQVLLIGMHIPPNYGPDFARQFFDMYAELAKRYRLAYVPFLLEGIVGQDDMFQQDRMHPTAKAQKMLLNNVWPSVQTLLKRGR